MIDTMYLAGGLIDAPELRFTPNGHAVASFRLAQSDHKKNDAGEWEKAAGRYIDCNIWDDTRGQSPKQWAHAIAELSKGTKLVVHGKLKTRTWEDKEGNKCSRLGFTADSFYIDGLAGANQQGGQYGHQAQQATSNAWGTPSPTGQDNDGPPY